MITDKLQGLGQWNVTLDGLPTDTFHKVELFGTVLVIPGRVSTPEARTRAELEAIARYAGVVRSRTVDADDPASVMLRGVHLNYWLGDEDGKGSISETELAFTGLQDFSTTMSTLLFWHGFAWHLPLNAGVITNPPSGGNYTGTHQWETLRSALDYITGVYGDAYWKVNTDRTIDIGPDTALFTTTPDALIVRRAALAGGDMGLRAARGQLRTAEGVEDYTTAVTLLGQADGAAVVSGDVDDGASADYTMPNGAGVQIRRVSTESGTEAANATARAQLQLNRFSSTRQQLTLSSDTHELAGQVSPGDQVHVYDPDAGLVDTSQQVNYRGQLITPVTIQVASVTWPVTDGMTVVHVHGDGTVTDLTPWIRWEAENATLVEVGDFPRTLTTSSGSAKGRVDDATNPGQDSLSPDQVVLAGTPWSTGVQQSDEGVATAYIIPVWTQPLNTDGSVITDGSHYEVQHRRAGASEWRSSTVGWGTVTVEVGELTPGADYDARVRAVDTSGNLGAWSATETTTAEGDTVAPSTPAAPITVAGNPLSIQVTHDLTKAATGALESDLASLQVYVGTSAGFTPGPTNRVGELMADAGLISLGISVVGSFPTFTDATRYVKVTAVDRAGNESAASASTSVNADLISELYVSSLSASDITTGTLAASFLAAGTITSAAIIIGSGGTMESDNFVTGGAGSGWRFTDTLAELNDVTIRGVLDGATGSFAGSLTAATGTFTGTVSAGTFTGGQIDIGGSDTTSFHVNSSGQHWAGHGTYGTSAPFRVSAAGALVAQSATITGAITSGSTITGTTITGSTLTSASSGIHLRITSTAAEWYSGTSSLRMRISQSGSTCTIGKVSNALNIVLAADNIGGTANIGNLAWNTTAAFTADLQNNGSVKVRASSSGAVLSRSATTSSTSFADIGFGVVGTESSRRVIKTNEKEIPTPESLARIVALGGARSFVFRQAAIGDGTNLMVELHEHLGIMAEDAAAVDRRYARYDWLDPDDPMKLAPIDNVPPFTVSEEWTDKEAKANARLHHAIAYAAAVERYPLEDAVPTNWDERAIVADLVGAVTELAARVAQLAAA
jgi:hypothetical protein